MQSSLVYCMTQSDFMWSDLVQQILDVRHERPRRQRFERKIAAFSDPTDKQITPVADQAELVETGHATADLHGQGE
jgi:hypothetical protein